MTSKCQVRFCTCSTDLCDLVIAFTGAPLWEILSAGEWRSPAFMSYLDLHQLDSQLVIQAHVDEESSGSD